MSEREVMMTVPEQRVRLTSKEEELRTRAGDEKLCLDELAKWQDENKKELDGGAREALLKLFHAGCSPVKILDHLMCHVNYPAELAKLTKEEMDRPADVVPPLEKLLQHLQNVRQELRRVAPPLSEQLASDMEIYAAHLQEWYLPILRWTPPKGMQSVFLHAAVQYVRLATGREYYGEMATILSSLSGEAKDEAVIGRICRNFEARTKYHLQSTAQTRREILRDRRNWQELRGRVLR